MDKQFDYYNAKKKATIVAMTLLDTEPCDVDGAEGFEVYVRGAK